MVERRRLCATMNGRVMQVPNRAPPLYPQSTQKKRFGEDKEKAKEAIDNGNPVSASGEEVIQPIQADKST